MERVGKYHYFIKKVAKNISKTLEISEEALETINSMVTSFGEKILFQVEILLPPTTKTAKHELFFLVGTSLPGEMSKHSRDFMDSVLYGNKTLIFPTKRTENFMRKKLCKRLSKSSVVAFTCMLEYITREILFSAKIQTEKRKRKRVNVRDIEDSVKKDLELQKLFGNGVFSGR